MEHIFHQGIKNVIQWEVILIDNNCSDDTVPKANALYQNIGKSIDFKVIEETTPGLMHARKRGISASKYEYLLFVDDDNWIGSDYVEKCLDILNQHPNTAILGGYGTAASSILPKWFEQYQHCYATGRQAQSNGLVPYVYGAGMCVRYSAWETLENSGHRSLLVGRMGKNLTSGEDTEMCYALRLLGFDIRYDDSLLFKHDLPDNRMNWAYLRKLFYGFGLAKARLDIYSATIDNRPIPVDGRLPFWFNRVAYLCRQLTPDLWILVKSMFAQMESDDRLLATIGKLGQISGIIQIRANYVQLYEEVEQLKTNNARP